MCSKAYSCLSLNCIKYTLIANNRQTVRGGWDAIPENQRIAFPSVDTAVYLATTLRILSVRWNVFGEYTTWVKAAILDSRTRN